MWMLNANLEFHEDDPLIKQGELTERQERNATPLISYMTCTYCMQLWLYANALQFAEYRTVWIVYKKMLEHMR